jgi:hypothetical protein
MGLKETEYEGVSYIQLRIVSDGGLVNKVVYLWAP